MTGCNVGIDVSRSCLDAHRPEDEVAARFDNSPSGYRALMKWLGTRPLATSVRADGAVSPGTGTSFGRDVSTGKGQPAAGQALWTGIRYADQSRRTGGTLACTDGSCPYSGAGQSSISEPVRTQGLACRAACSCQRADATAEPGTDPDEPPGDQAHARKRDILSSIPGLGPVATGMILITLPEIGAPKRKQAESLAGLVPHSRQSGQWRGKR